MLIPFSLYFIGLQHLDPTRAIVTACLEPVWAILLTAMILGELVRCRWWESSSCSQRRL
jgi:drug/metabolite transporter (DMT)-like permease